jgi:hypothetical protein
MSNAAQEKLRLPLIRKVFRQADTYICGLCKTDYKNYGDANSCMNQCWFDIHNFYPVVKRKRAANTWVFRCLFCCRDFTNEIGAYTCAKHCVGDRNRSQLREQLLNELPLPPPARPVSRLMMLARVIPIAPKIEAKGKEKAQLAAPVTTPEVGLAKTEAKEAFKGLHKSTFDKPINRKGEKYQCLYCREIHFTKVEAQGCFDHHFKEDGYETVVSIDPNA